ncbi:hypothetical protein C6497_07785 [Candidatus Poribacteria bacterium]|nr:MAG: hypothetical protein C6497_07785 [Candidatus Poribacteria bacterium]
MVNINLSSIPFHFSLLLSIFFLSVNIVEAIDDKVTTTESTQKTTQLISQDNEKRQTISSYSFDYEGVFTIELSLDFPANIDISSNQENNLQSNSIQVDLQQNPNIASKEYTELSIDNITLNGELNEGVLRLTTEILDIPIENHNRLHLTYSIVTPPDISLLIKANKGDINVYNIRGKMDITVDEGNINLFETLGLYNIILSDGNIKGSILMTPDQSKITTRNGSIELIILDNLAAPLTLTALGGGIRLLLPKDYPADLSYNSEKEQIIVNVPAEIDDNSGLINDGGPLLQLTTTGMISILPAPNLQKTTEETESDFIDEIISDRKISIPKTPIRPKIDGILTEKAWFYATKLTPFQSHDGNEEIETQTDVSVMYDEKFFYLGAKIYIPNDLIPRVSQTQLDSPIWEDECIEILLDMNPDTKEYQHIVINPIEAVFDQLVENVGYPPLKFFPSNKKKINIRHNYVLFKGDSSWNSDIIVETGINSNFWSVELALKRRPVETVDSKTWLLNIHRKAQGSLKNSKNIDRIFQREYSYWLPIHNEEHPWWPHSREAMGTLKFLENANIADTYTYTNKLEIGSIEINGNTTIPSETILKQLPFSSGNIISNEQLIWMLDEISTHDWFKVVKLQTSIVENTENSEQVKSEEVLSNNIDITDYENIKDGNNQNTSQIKLNLQFDVTESTIEYISNIKIDGNKSFPGSFIKNWFNISDGYLVDTSINLKKLMVEDFYINRGFPFAQVTNHIKNDELIITINEGYVDEIRFTGNRRLSQINLIQAFEFDKNEVFFRSLGQSKVNKLKNKLTKNNDVFKSIRNWYVQREGGKNLLIIEIEEQPRFKPGWFPIFGFNRVHGITLGAGGTLSTQLLGDEQLFLSIRRGFSSEIWNYRFGFEKGLFDFFPITFGVGLYRLTDSSTQAYKLRPADFDLMGALYGSTYENYYERMGTQYWITKPIGSSSRFRLGYRNETHDNLAKTTDWSYFNRGRVKNGNVRIEDGQQSIVSVSYTFDTRDRKAIIGRTDEFGGELILWPNERTRRGWYGNIGIQTAGKSLGGDFSYRLYSFEVNKYTKISGPQNINIRVAGDFSDNTLPMQRLLYLGGFTTLRGYPFNAFAGDNRVLLNVEYRLLNEILIDPRSDAAIGMTLCVFMDSGTTWEYGENPFPDSSLINIYTSVGLGLSCYISPQKGFNPFSAAVEFAFPLNESYFLKTYPIILRLERMF